MIGCANKLKDTDYYKEKNLILYCLIITNLLFVRVPMVIMFKKQRKIEMT